MIYTDTGAVISPDGMYRYVLWREWSGFGSDVRTDAEGHQQCVFIMFNPSTADAKRDDPTIRQCVRIAAVRRYARIVVVNLFAYRATNPREIIRAAGVNTEGPDNQRHLSSAVHDVRTTHVICAWGEHGAHLNQAEQVRGWIDSKIKLYALGFCKNGQPRHPLYMRTSCILQPMPK